MPLGHEFLMCILILCCVDELLTWNPLEFGLPGFVRPVLKQTQLENRKLQVVYDANKDGYNAQVFHKKVDGKGAAVVLAKVAGKWIGGYNPRGWASLGGSRPSVAAFVFEKNLLGWEKMRVKGRGGMACGKDEYNTGIFFGAEALCMPLDGADPKGVYSRLGSYFDPTKAGRYTLLPRAGEQLRMQELYVLAGKYEPGESIPNSGGVTDLGLY